MKVLVDGTLLIPNLIPEDAGNYTCIPTNGILTPPSASASLTVKRKRSRPPTRGFSRRPFRHHRVLFVPPPPPDPARVGRMPRETYLPAGMGGVIVCPVQADPPALYVNWTKDGNALNPDKVREDGGVGRRPRVTPPLPQFPGWIINSQGSVFITTANDNAVGMYTCTAYNSYGTMGRSDPTQVVLQVSVRL